MKRKITGIALACVLAFSQLTSAFAGVESVSVNGETIDFGDAQPTVIDDRTYVPIRSVFEKIGTVDWDNETKAVTISTDSKELVIYTVQGEGKITEYTVDNGNRDISYEDDFEFENKPVIIDGRTYLPLRQPAELLNASVDWDDETGSVKITTADVIISELTDMVKGKPLPEAYYIVSNYKGTSSADEKIIWNMLLENADCAGYDELIEVTNRMLNVSDGISEDDLNKLLGEYVSKYFDSIDSLDDKSFLDGYYKYVFVNAADAVIVDESYDENATAESCKAFVNGDSKTITTMPELRLPMQATVALVMYMEDEKKELDDDEVGEIIGSYEAFGNVIITYEYLNYCLKDYPTVDDVVFTQ